MKPRPSKDSGYTALAMLIGLGLALVASYYLAKLEWQFKMWMWGGP